MSDAERAVGAAAVNVVLEMYRQAQESEYGLLERWRAAGLTWAEIGELYGISEQGMRQRFARLEARIKGSGSEVPRVPEG